MKLNLHSDSILITKPTPSDTKIKWKEYNNSTFGLSLEYPAMWTVDSQLQGDNPYNSICDPASGTCFNIIVPVESGFTGDNLDEVSRIFLNSSIDASLGDRLLSPFRDGELYNRWKKAELFTKLSTIPDVVAERQNIIAIHDGRIYNFEFAGHFSTFSKPGVNEIGERIIKSINWTEIKWNRSNDSSLGVSMEYPSGWDLNSTANAMCNPMTRNLFYY